MSDKSGLESSTLEVSERRLRPVVLCLYAIAVVGGLAALVASASDVGLVLWLGCAMAWLVPTASNTLYLVRHRTTSVGMLPVSVVSLAPPLVVVACGSVTSDGVRLLCVVGLMGALLTGIVFGAWFWRLRATYMHASPPAPNAVVIVLGGAIRGGRPRPTLARRLDVALRLWREAPTRTLVVSGGALAHEEGTEADAMARYLVDAGMDDRRLLLEQRARNTAENIELSLGLLDDREVEGERCVLTSDYHLYRALREGMRLGCVLKPIPAPTPWTGCLQQWCREVLTCLYEAVRRGGDI